MRRALLHSGGNARGALGVPILEHLAPSDFDFAAGVSVGAVNVPEWAAGRVNRLRELYEEVDGLGWYLRRRWPWRWGSGLFSLDRLRDRMAAEGSTPDRLGMPVGVGVYDYEGDRYWTVPAARLTPAAWHDARAASCAIPVVMSGWDVEVTPGVVRRCYDGGMRHVIPRLPAWRAFDEVHVVLCSPIDRRDVRARVDVDDLRGIVGRTVDVWMDGVVLRDLERLHRYAAAGVRVVLYAPRLAGPSFDASPAAMRARLEEGVWMRDHPIVLGS